MTDKDKLRLDMHKDYLLGLMESDLGLKETQDMRALRQTMDATSFESDGELFKSLYLKYQILGEQEVDKLNDVLRPKGQIGLIVASAVIWTSQESQGDSFHEAINDAITYSENMGFVDIVRKLHQFTITAD